MMWWRATATNGSARRKAAGCPHPNCARGSRECEHKLHLGIVYHGRVALQEVAPYHHVYGRKPKLLIRPVNMLQVEQHHFHLLQVEVAKNELPDGEMKTLHAIGAKSFGCMAALLKLGLGREYAHPVQVHHRLRGARVYKHIGQIAIDEGRNGQMHPRRFDTDGP